MFQQCFCRDLLQTLTEEELITLEKNLCISQDGELSTDQGLDTNCSPAPVQENHSSCSPANVISKAEHEGEQEHLALFVCPSQEEQPAEVEKGWDDVETERGEEEQEQGLLCEEAEEAELACSMQYDEEELEQLNMMVYRVGDEMTTLLSPPSQGQSPAHNPHRGQAGGSSGASSTEASPHRLLVGRGRTGIYVEEEDKVFLMEDVDAAGDTITSISREASPSKAPKSARPVQRKPGPRPDSSKNGWYTDAQSEQPCPQPRSRNTHCPNAKHHPCTSTPGSEPLPYTNGWEMGLEGTASETAEVIAHRMGGMKLSATVIFNPRSPSLTELTVDKLLLPRPTPTEIEPCGPLVATHCLLHSCVCCGSCDDGHEDAISTETTGLGLGLALGLDRHCKTAAPNSVIQSSACWQPTRGHEPHCKGELTQLTPPSSRCSAENLEEDSSFQLCEKCLVVTPVRGHHTQNCGSSREDGPSQRNHKMGPEKSQQASGGQQRDKEKDKPGTKDSRRDTEDSKRSSRCVVIPINHFTRFLIYVGVTCFLLRTYNLDTVLHQHKYHFFHHILNYSIVLIHFLHLSLCCLDYLPVYFIYHCVCSVLLLFLLFFIFMCLFLVLRTLPSALCQVVTVRVCRSPHVVCQAVHTLPGNQSIMKGCVTIIFL